MVRRRLLTAAVLALVALPAAATPSPESARSALQAWLEPEASFPLRDPFDYSDVILLGNNNSASSKNLTAHFAQVRGVPAANIFLADLPVAETISEATWDAFAAWFTGEMANRSLGAGINYIVTFKGVPIRVSWSNPNGPTSFQDALMLLGGSYAGWIGIANLWSNPYWNRSERFTFAQFGMRLVTGIYAYNESTALQLIDRSSDSLGARGEYVLDVDPSPTYGYFNSSAGWGSYGYANSALLWANATLTSMGEDVFLDTTTTYLTGRSDVIGYSSWGSNDFNDQFVTENAKPHNTWVNGSIGETFVSTGGRTFTWPPAYGQSLIADWIDEGATGMKGYTDEPYISAIADGHILYPRYASGYNLAESYWAASHLVGWRQIVIGDPKMAPYADIPDLSINTSLTASPAQVEQFGVLNLSFGVDNTGALEATPSVHFSLGGVEVHNVTVAAPAHSAAMYNVPLNLSALDPDTWGALNLTVQVDRGGLVREWDEANNSATFPIEVRRPPVATAAFERGTVFTFETVNFSMWAPRADRPIDHFELVIDGATAQNLSAAADNATYTAAYAKSGSHSFSVVAVDSAGLRSAAVGPLWLAVANRNPTAAIAANNSNPLSLEPVSFSGAGSTDMDGSVRIFTWDAGTLGFGAGPEFALTFPRPGDYLVVLTVTDDEGAFAQAFLIIAIGNRAPQPVLEVNVTSTLTLLPVFFSAANSSDPDGQIVSYEFQFDDGTLVNQTSPEVTHAFATPGTWGAWLEVTDDWGATARTRLAVIIENRAPVVTWSAATRFAATEGVSSAFEADVQDLDSNLTSFSVDFGDGTRTTGVLSGGTGTVAVSHIYASEGVWSLALVVADEWGTSTTVYAPVNVSHPAPVVASEIVDVSGSNLTVTFLILSPYATLELAIEIDGAPWRQVAIDSEGTYRVRLADLAPGNHTVAVSVTDGTKTTPLSERSFVVEAPPLPPPPPPPGTGTGGAPSGTLVFLGIAAAIAAGAVALAVFLRRRKPGA